MEQTGIPSTILNWISGTEVGVAAGETFRKLSPVSGKLLTNVVRSRVADVEQAVRAAQRAQKG